MHTQALETEAAQIRNVENLNLKKPTHRLFSNPINAALILFILTANANAIAGSDYTSRSVAQLIDDLTLIDSPAPGIDGGSMYRGFIANNTPGNWTVGVLGVPAPTLPPQMVELVRRGPVALPELLKHLTDARPTKLQVGNRPRENSSNQVGVDSFWWTVFSDEYDPRSHEATSGRSLANGQRRDFSGRYTVRVGDICFVLIGQIVNRGLYAVRYQPSAGLVVNSPIEMANLAEDVMHDWYNADAQALRASLSDDVRAAAVSKPDTFVRYRAYGALERLRLYFPDDYGSLEGPALQVKRAFEEEEVKKTSQK